MDIEITRWINSFAGTNLIFDSVMIRVTQFGLPLIVAFVILQWWSVLDRTHIRHTDISAGLSLLLGLAINQLILIFVHRLRPYDAGISHLLISRSSDWSFPSDHATASISVASAFFIQKVWGRGLLIFIAALLVCLSRVYVGVHYTSDVFGGAISGALAAAIVYCLYKEGSALDRFMTKIL